MARILKTAEKGYGAAHQRLRREWSVRVAAGTIRCARCGRRILPSEPWDLGHVDGDKSSYAGPEHRACNRSTYGRSKRARPRFSRMW